MKRKLMFYTSIIVLFFLLTKAIGLNDVKTSENQSIVGIYLFLAFLGVPILISILFFLKRSKYNLGIIISYLCFAILYTLANPIFCQNYEISFWGKVNSISKGLFGIESNEIESVVQNSSFSDISDGQSYFDFFQNTNSFLKPYLIGKCCVILMFLILIIWLLIRLNILCVEEKTYSFVLLFIIYPPFIECSTSLSFGTIFFGAILLVAIFSTYLKTKINICKKTVPILFHNKLFWITLFLALITVSFICDNTNVYFQILAGTNVRGQYDSMYPLLTFFIIVSFFSSFLYSIMNEIEKLNELLYIDSLLSIVNALYMFSYLIMQC